MNIIQRISQLLSANINHLLDKAEDPEVMIKQLIRDMEEGIIDLRRETVKAIGHQKHLEKQIAMEKGRTGDLEKKAAVAVADNNEDLARQLLEKKLASLERIVHLNTDLKNAITLAAQLKADLVKMEDQVQSARRKKEELIRRKRAAEAQMRSQGSIRQSQDAIDAINGSVDKHISAIGSYEDKIIQMEAEVEATEELLKMTDNDEEEADLEKLARERAVEEELRKLKRKSSDSEENKKE